MSHTITDRQGGKNPREVCRVCGAAECHTVEYGRPTMQCIEFLREQAKLCTALAQVLQDWETMSPTGQDDWVFKRRDVLEKYEEQRFREIGL